MSPTLHAADHFIIIGYFVLLASIGVYFWRRMRHVRDFFTGANDIPWWLAGVSFYLTAFSAFTFVAYSEMAYRYGFVAVTLTWSSAVAMITGTLFLSRRWRRSRILSPVEFLEARYSPAIRQVLAWAGLPLKLIDDGLKIYATGIFVSVGLGYDLKTSVIVCGVVMALYTMMGGLWAVVVTDYVQFVILTVGVAVLFPLVFNQLGGFFAGMQAVAADAPAGFFSPVTPPFSWFYVFAFYLLIQFSYNGNWAFAQKFYSVRDERAARNAGLLATFLKIVGPPLFILPAMAARKLMPELMVAPNSPQYTYAALSLRFLPAGLMGLIVAAMFSATMSTLSGDYNVMASVITQDIYHRLIDRRASDRRLVVVGRLATLFVGAITVMIGVVLVGSARRGLFEVMVALFTIFVGPMLIPMLAGLLIRRITWKGAAAGIAAGFASGLALYVYKNYVLLRSPGVNADWVHYDFEAITILVNFGITVLAMVIASAVAPAGPEERARIDAFFERLRKPIAKDAVAPDAKRAPFSPFYLIGWITAGVSVMLLCAAAIQPAGQGRAINALVAGILMAISAAFFLLNRRFTRRNSL